jgi:hypothetical protein
MKKVVKNKSRLKLMANEETGTHFVFDALVLPYGGDKPGNVDCAGERFTPQTDFKVNELPNPPVVYAHGYPMDAAGEADRIVVGDTFKRWFDSEGGWAKLGIRKDTPLTDEVMDAYKRGKLTFSSMAILARKASNKIDYEVWLPGEFTVVTDKTGVPACNLLTRAGVYGKMALADIWDNSLNEEEAKNLKKYLEGEGEDSLDPNAPLTGNDNPAGADGDKSDLQDFGNEEDGDDMTPEELQAAIAAGLAPVMTRIEALESKKEEKPPAGGTEKREKMDKADDGDDDLSSFVDGKVSRMKTDGLVVTNATKLVDGYIAQGLIAPDDRQAEIKLASAAIEGDGRKKIANGALATWMGKTERGNKVSNADRLKAAGFNPSADQGDFNEADVKGMTKAAFE